MTQPTESTEKTQRIIVSFGEYTYGEGGEAKTAYSNMFQRTADLLGFEAVEEIPESEAGIALRGSKGDKSYFAIIENSENLSGEGSLSIPLPGWIRNKDAMNVIFSTSEDVIAVVTPDGRRFGRPSGTGDGGDGGEGGGGGET